MHRRQRNVSGVRRFLARGVERLPNVRRVRDERIRGGVIPEFCSLVEITICPSSGALLWRPPGAQSPLAAQACVQNDPCNFLERRLMGQPHSRGDLAEGCSTSAQRSAVCSKHVDYGN